MLRKGPFTPAERVLAWLLAGGVAALAIAGVAFGILNRRPHLSAAGIVMLGLAALYAAAARRGRPF